MEATSARPSSSGASFSQRARGVSTDPSVPKWGHGIRSPSSSTRPTSSATGSARTSRWRSSMAVVDDLADAGIDLIEISGGTYEAPAMMGPSRVPSTAAWASRPRDTAERGRRPRRRARGRAPRARSRARRAGRLLARAHRGRTIDVPPREALCPHQGGHRWSFLTIDTPTATKPSLS